MTARGGPRQDLSESVHPSAKRKRADTDEPVPLSKKPRLAASLNLSSAEDVKVLQAVEAKYDVQIHSVISSYKIRKKVTSILRQLVAPPPNEADGLATASAAPAATAKVAVLRAKASDASKLISIAEIAKRELEKGDLGGSDRWFQYIALGEQLAETPRRERDAVVEETKLGGAGAGEDDGDDFEIMKTPLERALEGRPRLRGTPVMSLFLSQTSIEELKNRFGEQSNLHPA
ncbi:hypothetical protein GGS23DRAFT_240297 [Durotheca rogersii]|uniref:uncharacterized protein n=1 Tax=Durotheca rogersii TaxID=419775 RepID=UPI00221F1A81|nr:uncharacterized protein GGS23DRAFT_240297 [Durotheca rogersii]KAI5860218.1 hypothetical protein GGS23DRAFT_240297 [Durotheca rogersii]